MIRRRFGKAIFGSLPKLQLPELINIIALPMAYLSMRI